MLIVHGAMRNSESLVSLRVIITAKEIIGAYCITKKEDDSKEWLVKGQD